MTALSDALIYSSPLLGEMDFFGDCTDCCTWKMSLEAGGIPCASAHMVAAFTLCAFKPWISSPLLWEAPTIVQFTFSHLFLGGFCFLGFFLPQNHTRAAFKSSNMLINTAYYYAAPTANLSSDSLLVTWSLCRIHQTNLPMCRARNWIFKRGSHWWTPWHLCLCAEIIFLVLPLYSGQ